MFSICYNCCIKLLKHQIQSKNIKPFINQYNWKEINFPSHKNDSRKFESNNKSIAINILYILYIYYIYIYYNSEEIRHQNIVFKT